MKDFEWIYKSFIGAGGAVFTFLVDYYSPLMAAVAGTLTVIYLAQQVIYTHWKKNASLEVWEHEKEEREYQKNSRKTHKSKDPL